MIQYPGDFGEQCPNPFCPLRNLNVQQLLHAQREALLVCHHAHVVEAIKVRQCLKVRAVLNQLLRPTMQQPNVRIRSDNLLAIEFEDQTQNAVRCRMLWAEIDLKAMSFG
jgi:hypothetical protein